MQKIICSLLVNSSRIQCNVTIRRNLNGKRPYNWEEGVHYHGFKYYPRHPDQKDPPYEPSKLFRIQRIRPVKGTAFWERKLLREFKLDGPTSDVAIIKNIPENNSRLYRIKHLIKMTPITFPNGFPTDGDTTFLKESGELIVTKQIQPENDIRFQAITNFQQDSKRLDGDTLRRDSRKKWLTGW